MPILSNENPVRRFWARLGVIGLVLLLLMPGMQGTYADTIVNDQVDYYRVEGCSAEAIRASLNANSPTVVDGKSYDANTDCNISWQYQWWETAGSCRMTSVTSRVTIKTTLPRLVEADCLPASLRGRWYDYTAALEDHEAGHRRFGVEAARAIERELMSMAPRSDCKQLYRAAESRARDILAVAREKDRQYDRETEFGARTGAIFP